MALEPINLQVVTAQSAAVLEGVGARLPFLANEGAVARTMRGKLRDTLSVLDYGADPTGVADSTAAFQAALNAAKGADGLYPLGGAGRSAFRLAVPSMAGGFYKITDTLVIDGTHGLIISGDGAQEKRSGGVGDSSEAAIRWYGATSKPIFQLKGQTGTPSNPNFFIAVEDLSISGAENVIGLGAIPAGVALAGIYLGPLAGDANNTLSRHVIIRNCSISNCRFGIYSGNPSDLNTDHATVVIDSCMLFNNAQAGLVWGTGNSVGILSNAHLASNGWDPFPVDAYAPEIGVNVYLSAGYLDITSYTSSGAPTNGDIYQASGRVSVINAWSDTHGHFFYQAGGGTTISPAPLTGIRHYADDMTLANTPTSIRLANPGMMVTSSNVYGNIELSSGFAGRPILSGINFIRAGATYTGTGVTTQRTLLSLGHGPGNAAQIAMGGRDTGQELAHVGYSVPQLLSMGCTHVGVTSILQAIGAASGDSLASIHFDPATGGFEFFHNCYLYDGSANFRARKVGPAFRILLGYPGTPIKVTSYYFADTTTSVPYGNFAEVGGIKVGVGVAAMEGALMAPLRAADPVFNSGDFWKGSIYFNTTLNKLKVNVGGSTWQTITST